MIQGLEILIILLFIIVLVLGPINKPKHAILTWTGLFLTFTTFMCMVIYDQTGELTFVALKSLTELYLKIIAGIILTLFTGFLIKKVWKL